MDARFHRTSSITLREPDESPPERVLKLLTYVSLSAAHLPDPADSLPDACDFDGQCL
jgi:hypothetical protein